MKSYEIYSCRRKALRISINDLAKEVGCDRQYIVDFESGKRVPSFIYNNIKTTIRNKFNDLSPVEHYRARILELGIELRDETDKQIALNEISHMMIELGKLQGELLGFTNDIKEES